MRAIGIALTLCILAATIVGCTSQKAKDAESTFTVASKSTMKKAADEASNKNTDVLVVPDLSGSDKLTEVKKEVALESESRKTTAEIGFSPKSGDKGKFDGDTTKGLVP